MSHKKLTYLVAALALALTLTVPNACAADSTDTFVVEAAYEAVSAGDIEAAVAFLTEDAMFTVVPASSRMPAPALVGKEQIGAWWSGTYKDNGRVEFANLTLDGDRASFTCLYHGSKLEKLGVSPAEFDGVAILRDGKIRALVWSYTAEYEPKLHAALAKLKK
ncbi:nuclear transport factor 2 family protein [Tropicimonas sp. TH_r6]|uniref:nuclear transport factor 2 family protein n=1 Tax=Tropicimonas sp. TH_r6 TaxID=3082085 RepID=UPI002955241F|nr:nuclear transport factor 2 family protein [Tropicimonas sp. TH_r6]MDV7141652.1 nuclear transport factor 2 family protein [Tropicimonas sp. TH_r6]